MIGRVSQLSIALSIKTKANKYFNLCKTITNNFFFTLIIHSFYYFYKYLLLITENFN
jgi:hypothetical protein